MKKGYVVLIVLLGLSAIYGQTFTDINAGLIGIEDGSVAWGDYDNDGDLDILLTGHSDTGSITKIYRNDSGLFNDINAELVGFSDCSVAWGDYDNDNYIDIIITGYPENTGINPVIIYRNNQNSTFTDINAGIIGDLEDINRSTVAWGDYDNDGDLDILLTGMFTTPDNGYFAYSISKIFKNIGNNSFIETNSELSGVYGGATSWGDYDNDGDLDIFLNGKCTSLNMDISKIYRNDGNDNFTDIDAALYGNRSNSSDWVDYDNDGDLDLFYNSMIYRNDSGVFSYINTNIEGLPSISFSWGDYDNDGDLDVLLTGEYYVVGTGLLYSARIFRNDGNGDFTDIGADLEGVGSSAVACGDYDNDGDLDFILTGDTATGSKITRIYRNDTAKVNVIPNSPSNLSSVIDRNIINFKWDRATDTETPVNALSYNIYIGSSSQNGNVKCSMSNNNSGYRKVVSIGNIQKINSWTLFNLPNGTYYWSVQAIDNSFSGSLFAEEQSFIFYLPPPNTPNALPATNISGYGFTANWESVEGVAGYYIDISVHEDFSSFVEPYNNYIISDTTTSLDIKGLSGEVTYYYRIRAFNDNQGISENSNTVSLETLLLPFIKESTDFRQIYNNSASWGDYDNDGDLDLLLPSGTGDDVSLIYRYDSGHFTETSIGFNPAVKGQASWWDYDNDGDLDVAVNGEIVIDIYSSLYSRIYRNEGNGNFRDMGGSGMTAVAYSSTSYGDYDNDGDLDVLISGYTGSNPISKIFRNDSGVFIDANIELEGVCYGSTAWGDYDNDGDLDILITGFTGTDYISKIYNNDSMIFSDINAGLAGVFKSSGSFGDFDSDGDLDILITGSTGADYTSKVYKNDGNNVFSDINADLINLKDGASLWGDYDNDGDLDILLSGLSNSEGAVSRVYRNDGDDVFSDINTGLIGVYSHSYSFYETYRESSSSAVWGDYDNDGDLDIFLSGYTGSEYVAYLYKNNCTLSNNSPVAPTNLISQVNQYNVNLSWNKATDTETPQDGLTYNLYIGTDSNRCEIKTPMSDIGTGYRKIVSAGNLQNSNLWKVNGLYSGTYYWSVQAVDNVFNGSAFSEENSFIYNLPLPSAPIALQSTYITEYNFIANWNVVDKATGYKIDVSENEMFNSYIGSYNDYDVGNNTSYTVEGLKDETTYYCRIRAYNYEGGASESSNVISTTTHYSQFSRINVDLTGVSLSAVAWGDYDNDNDLDILITGDKSGPGYISRIYRNDNNSLFTDANVGLTGIIIGSVEWGDYDNDLDLDILLSGSSTLGRISKIYQNEGNDVFTDINAGLLGVDKGSVTWGDYDNDGDLDILLSGYSSGGNTRIYRNDDRTFNDINVDLPGLFHSSATWTDFDNDGDLDILITGYTGSGCISRIYRNDTNGVFTDIDAGLVGIDHGSVAWGDYDNDGDLDVVLTGDTGSTKISKIYRNDAGIFTDINANLIGVRDGSVAWGDYDNDGYLDIIITGYTGSSYISRIYRNDTNGVFIDIDAGLGGIDNGSVAWGDYDKDGDLDLLFSGEINSDEAAFIYRNNSFNLNTKPTPPDNLTSEIIEGSTILSWDKATDSETPQDGLSYNLYLGTENSEGNIYGPMSNISDGYRKIVDIGNVGQKTSRIIKNLEPGIYYWSVQAIDNAYAGSIFAPEQTFSYTGIDKDNLPLTTALNQNYPNPFNPVTVIKYSLVENAQVELNVYNLNGQLVQSLVNGRLSKGMHKVEFSGADLTSGMYIYNLKVDNKVISSKKMMLLK